MSTNALPHASALASIHSGTITGKLNGVMPTTTPTGCSTVCTSIAGRDLGAVRALEEVRDAARELDALEAPRDLAPGVVEHLAVLGGDQRGQVVATSVDQLAQSEHRRVAPAQRRSRASRRPRRPRP